MNFIMQQFTHLPVAAVLDKLVTALTSGHAVLSGPTGSGKTTLTPLFLLNHPVVSSGKIIMLEPRRIAARTAAMRMSSMLGEKTGTTIGYITRLESKISKATRVEVVTEGILIRKLQQDPELTDYNLVIFDEFHERSLNSDLALALCYDLAQLRDDLRLLVMSATLEAEGVCRMLDEALHIKATGRSFPVTISHLPPVNEQASISQQMIRGILHCWQHHPGDILAFLPGAGEIHQCQKRLEIQLPEALILPLYGNLNHDEQDRIFTPEPNRRRIILATPIAETSLTIEGISCVVDSGYYRRPVFDHASGLSRLATFRISKASAEQRSGRAGRLGPGYAIRLWSQEVEYSLLGHTPPEIINADLSSLVLELGLWGVADPDQLHWLNPPRESAWKSAIQLLKQLNLVDDHGGISALGKKVALLPVHPRLGVILIKSAELGMPWTGCLLAATLTEKDLFNGRSLSVDIESRLRVLAEFADKSSSLPPHADRSLCRRLCQYARQWLGTLSAEREKYPAYHDIGNLLAFGYPDRIARLRANSNSRYLLAGGSGAELIPGDLLSSSPLLVVPQVDSRQGDGRIFMAATVTEQDLRAHHPHLFRKEENIFWDKQEKRVKAVSDICLGKIILESSPLPEPDMERVAETFLEGVQQSGIGYLGWNREARELQARICSLFFWQPGNWPEVDDTALMADISWLAPYCFKMQSLDELRSLNMKTLLLSLLNWQQQRQLETLAPSHLPVPSGSRIRLDYVPGNSPVLAVRLQELFGLTDTPSICNNSVQVVLHLLSPAGRPMQITSDLHSFWLNIYPEVRKELAGRYPKHYWPENPLEAQATARTKKQRSVNTS